MGIHEILRRHFRIQTLTRVHRSTSCPAFSGSSFKVSKFPVENLLTSVVFDFATCFRANASDGRRPTLLPGDLGENAP